MGEKQDKRFVIILSIYQLYGMTAYMLVHIFLAMYTTYSLNKHL